MNKENWKPQTALVSVTDKTDIVRLCQGLKERGITTILSTGGTAKLLREEGQLAVTDVAELVRGSLRTLLARHGIDERLAAAIVEETGGQFLGDRVKTLSREKSAALLAQRTPEDHQELERIGVPMIDIVVCNFYELEKAIATPGITEKDVIAKTDVGGPTMAHEAAKGRRLFVTDPKQYDAVLAWFDAGCPDLDEVLRESAAEADWTSGRHVLTSGVYHGKGKFAALLGRRAKGWDLKYGENPQSQSVLYAAEGNEDPLAIHRFTLLPGHQAPSHVNVTDIDRVLKTVTHIAAVLEVNGYPVPLIAVAVKHGNPCGAAVGDDPADVLRRMLDGNLDDVHGAVMMTNFPIGKDEADLLRHYKPQPGLAKRLLDGIVAPDITPEAVPILERKDHGKCRLVVNAALASLSRASLDPAPRVRALRGGFLLGDNYNTVLDLSHPRLRVTGELREEDKRSVLLMSAIVRTANSNTIGFGRGGMLVALGAGQQSRVACVDLAVSKGRRAGHDMRGTVLCSDAFFPFNDGPASAIAAGVRVIDTTHRPDASDPALAAVNQKKDDRLRRLCEAADVVLVEMPDNLDRRFAEH